MSILFANNALSQLAGAISSGATSAALQAGTGTLFPAPTGSDYFCLTFTDAATGLLTEIVHVTNVTGDTITMIRAQEGTTARSWQAGDFANNEMTAGTANAFIQQSDLFPARLVSASGAFTTNLSDRAIGLNRTTSLATSSTTLPSGAAVGAEYSYADLIGNFYAYPLTVTAPAGQTIANETAIICNQNRQTAIFTYYGSNLWGVKL